MPLEPPGPEDPARRLAGGVAPPPALKWRVLHTLRARGLVTAPVRPGRAVTRVLLYAAAALVLFAGGALVGGRRSVSVADTRPRFALFLYEDAAFRPTESHRALVAEYSAWADSLRRLNALVMGEELDHEDAAVLFRSGSAVTISPGDVESAAGNLTGLFIVRATSREEAFALARQCPHLKYGGRVALRRLTDS
ncbi:MAG TPA: YciI family protein [Gemmatimonadales bacterium]|jgi:hypothetical protein